MNIIKKVAASVLLILWFVAISPILFIMTILDAISDGEFSMAMSKIWGAE